MRDVTKRRSFMVLQFDVDHVMIFLVLFFSCMNIYMRIQYSQFWALRYYRYFHYALRGLLVSSAAYIVWVYVTGGFRKLRPFVLSVFLYLIYMTVVSVFFYPEVIRSLLSAGLCWPLAMVACYLYAERNEISWFYRLFLLLFFLMCLIPMTRVIQSRYISKANVGVVNYLLSFLPMIYLLCSLRVSILVTVLSTVYVIFSLKRGAFLALALVVFLILLYFMYTNRKTSRLFIVLVLTMVLLAAIVVVAQRIPMVQQMLERLDRISDDNGSGRLVIWETLMERFEESPVINKIFGHGYQAFPRDVAVFDNRMFAHNSYLEILYDLGIVGAGWLIAMILAAVVQTCRVIRKKETMVYPALAALAITGVFSMVSYYFEECASVLMVASFMGMVMGQQQRAPQPEKKEKQKTKYRYLLTDS